MCLAALTKRGENCRQIELYLTDEADVTRAEHTITFREREFKGSRLRCLLVTSQEATEIANFFTPLVAPHAVVTLNDTWAHPYPTEAGFIAALHSAFRIFATEISATLSDGTVLDDAALRRRYPAK